jgi:hypothetical protein
MEELEMVMQHLLLKIQDLVVVADTIAHILVATVVPESFSSLILHKYSKNIQWA